MLSKQYIHTARTATVCLAALGCLLGWTARVSHTVICAGSDGHVALEDTRADVRNHTLLTAASGDDTVALTTPAVDADSVCCCRCRRFGRYLAITKFAVVRATPADSFAMTHSLTGVALTFVPHGLAGDTVAPSPPAPTPWAAPTPVLLI